MVFEKPNIRECNKDGEYKSKDGIHIVFPDIKANKKIYNKFVEQFLQEENVEIFDELENTCLNNPDNNIETIIDKINL